MSVVAEAPNYWVELKDPQTGKIFFANPSTGECSWDKPEDSLVRPRDGANEWWELYDEVHKLCYYYNIETNKTVWVRPTTGTITPLSAIQDSAINKRMSLFISEPPTDAEITESNGLPRISQLRDISEPSTPLEPTIVAVSGTFDIQHAKLLPPWTQVLDRDSGRNYYINGDTGEETWDRAVATGLDTKGGLPQAIQVGIQTSEKERADVMKTAVKKGVSEPSLNREAASSLSLLNPNNYKTPTDADRAARPVRLPDKLQQQIIQFNMEGFARKYFGTHKKGIFRRKVPVETMLKWTKETIPAPILTLNKENAKEALNAWRLLQRTMGDRSGTQKIIKPLTAQYQLLDGIGVTNGAMRDELYVQLMKQLTENPNPESEVIGWEIMAVYVLSFPPSKNLEQYLLAFLDSASNKASNEKIQTQAAFCKKKLPRMTRSGAKGKVPTIPEIERFIESAFKPSVFGETLEEIMEMQKLTHPQLNVPRILIFLTEAVMTLNGAKTEGIFRVPGDVEMVTELQLRLERFDYKIDGITDAGVPASLLKLFLRELAEPLIPEDCYSEAVQFAEDPMKCVQLLSRLSDLNRKVVYFVVKFLQGIADPANQPFTKMTVNNLAMVFAPNFLRCPSDNPQTIFENTKFEQSFVRHLILHLNTGPARQSTAITPSSPSLSEPPSSTESEQQEQ